MQGRCVEEAERHAVPAPLHRVVHQVCVVQPTQIGVARPGARGPVAVHDAVVHQHVDQPEPRHPGAHPLQRVVAGIAQHDQGDRGQGQDQQVDIVGFQRAQVRFVVRAMQKPAPAVHHVPVRQITDTFHGDQGAEKNREVGNHGRYGVGK